MITIRKSDFAPEKTYVELTPGDAVRIARELSEMTQADLSKLTGISQAALSAIETGTSTLGADRALRIGEALGVHPGVLLFPMWKPKLARKAVAKKKVARSMVESFTQQVSVAVGTARDARGASGASAKVARVRSSGIMSSKALSPARNRPRETKA